MLIVVFSWRTYHNPGELPLPDELEILTVSKSATPEAQTKKQTKRETIIMSQRGPDISDEAKSASRRVTDEIPGEHKINSDRLHRALSARQVQMIAIGGTIGTGLFLGTGKSLATGGPASVLIAYAIVGGIVFTTMLSLGEMAAFIPVAGSFCTFAG